MERKVRLFLVIRGHLSNPEPMALGVDACYATIEVQVKVVGENRLWVSGLVSPVSSPECRFFFFFFIILLLLSSGGRGKKNKA